MRIVIKSLLLVAVGTFAIAGGDIGALSSEPEPEATCKADAVYIDYKSGLMWQDAPYGDTEDGAYKHNRSAGKAGRWKYAQNYCDDLEYAGFSDWRLPKVDEITHLYSKKLKLKNNIAMDFWTSTPSKGNTYYSVYAVIEGQPFAHKRGDTQYIRCVRCLGEPE
ncbi:hypothetical protein MNB_SV-6-307 [hydrothermal vent metagenome]|uniref:Lcl C-terminal domain-containing protein n=1 Tax=hydrothermal vent metagenome TaxID=652676 RepID=A0A1W1CFX6_9ZZZZ